MRQFISILLSLTIGLTALMGQSNNGKSHAEQLDQYGQFAISQDNGFTGVPRDLVPRSTSRSPSHVVFGYHPYWNGTAYQNYEYSMLSHIAWFGLAMGVGGNITNANGWPVSGLVDIAHSHGVKVIVTVTLFDNDDIGTLLANTAYRQAAIDNLIARVIQGNADGVNIDFEFVPASAKENFNTFIHDLTQAFHDQIPGSEVSIAMPSVDWSNAYDYNYLSDNCDGLMIMAYGYFWSGSSSAGPISPLNSGMSNYYIRRTLEDYLTKTGGDGSQLILGLPWYGRNWPVASTEMGAATTGTGSSIFYSTAEAAAQTYGKHYNSTVAGAWYNYDSGGLRQVWYDDSLSLATKYNYAKASNIKGIGIWALGYDGGRSEIWGGLSDAFGATAPPLASQYFTVRNAGNGDVAIHCAKSSYTDSYSAFTSQDGVTYTLAASSAGPEFTLSGLPDDQITYVKIQNSNVFGSSGFSEVLGVVTRQTAISKVLIVQGFERTSGTVNNFDYIIEHGSAIYANGHGFDAASNDAVETNLIHLEDYDIVDWISGEEATATTSFSPAEQSLIMTYLEQGGRLFISGSEIGYHLEANGSNNDYNFYRNYFKADYVSDDARSYSTFGTDNGIFSGLSNLDFDNGTHGTYDVDYPDGIKPFGGSVNNLRYEGTDYTNSGGAGIQYMGNFGDSNALGGIVYLGFGFETIYPEASRVDVMARVLSFLGTSLATDHLGQIPETFSVSTAYPNPFNGSFAFNVRSENALDLTISIYNLKGQLVDRTLEQINVGNNRIVYDSPRLMLLSSGVYLLQVSDGHETHTQNITYLK